MSRGNKIFAQGIQVKTVKGRNGDFPVLWIDIQKLKDFMDNNCESNGNYIKIALYERPVADEHGNTHSPTLFQ